MKKFITGKEGTDLSYLNKRIKKNKLSIKEEIKILKIMELIKDNKNELIIGVK